ncbi:MAG TPA: DinB family protein [Vicinamibacterales bacterium]|nr:DinB family protein [Vicinamibacterales bacterium]
MYDAHALIDVHTRAHESLRRLIAFCGGLTHEELRRPLTGFGWPTVLRQLEHTIGAEVYWQTVLTRGYREEATLPELPDVAAIEMFRQRTALATRSYLAVANEAELNTPRRMISDPGQTRVLRPADVIIRVVTHIFTHQGQVLAMCRTLGKPNDRRDLDYPIV